MQPQPRSREIRISRPSARVRASAGRIALRGLEWSGALALAAMLAAAAPAAAHAQCTPPKSSNEARLLAFYEAPIAFSTSAAPTPLPAGAVRVEAEVVPIPTPSAEISRTGYCFTSKNEHTRLAPVFARPRIVVGLPLGFAFEASYVPPVRVYDADPNLASFALSNVRRIPTAPTAPSLAVMLRAHGTIGRVRGPITCPAKGLQTSDDTLPCFGTRASNDTFHPYQFGGEGALSLTTRGGRWSLWAGGGVSWLRPRFQVGFTDANAYTDSTRVDVNLVRGSVFGGITAHFTPVVELSASVYAVPADVTTFRFGAGYRLH
ncbi:MAG TPA: hypothetical protein VFS44_05265 [Gemmatimonadaceae bacterium]|nr:hypothetical protein [Gemmatimonadaceae bacterium]